jgi:hypothetical protein
LNAECGKKKRRQSFECGSRNAECGMKKRGQSFECGSRKEKRRSEIPTFCGEVLEHDLGF